MTDIHRREPDDFDDELVDPDRDLHYLKYAFDGAATLDDLAASLRRYADGLIGRRAEGWQLEEPVDGGWAQLVRSPVAS